MPNKNILFYVIPKKSFKVGSRDFIKGQKYPVFYDINGFLVVYAENGSFNFGNRLISQLINEWGLKVTDV